MTIKDADYKYKKIVELDDMMKQNGSDAPGWKNLQEIGIDVSRDFFKISAEEVECSELMMG